MTGVVPFVDLRAQYATIRAEIRAAVDRVLESQEFILGAEVEALEREIADDGGAKFAIGVSSGTDALIASLMALGVGPGDEVVTSAHTFIATATSIARLGARPVFVDIDPVTFALDPSKLAARLTPRTRAIVPVHLFGRMAEMGRLLEIASRHRVPVIEDAAQALGAECAEGRAGSLGISGCLSFYPSKILGAMGDAGMVLTSDGELATRIRQLRSHGQSPKYFAQVVGGNFRMDAIQAAILRVKRRHFETWVAARQRHAATYRRLFEQAGLASMSASGAKGAPLVLPSTPAAGRHTYHQFVIRCLARDELRAFLADRGIATEIYYPLPMHLQPCFAGLGHRQGDFPEAERAARESLAVPIYPELTLAMQEQVVAEVARFYSNR
jgi:dTDP-4-amino-4,6-dideoxygalactose transaminase